MLWKQCILAFVGLSAGWLVSAGVFAFTVMVGVVTRMVARTKTVKYLWIYEDCVVLGGALGNLVSLYQPVLQTGSWLLGFYGFFSGIYAGALAIALAEIVNAIPVFSHRIRLRQGMRSMIVAFAAGKLFGSLWMLFM